MYDEYTEGVDQWELAELLRHVLRGECPPEPTGGDNGCVWAEDCLACWMHYGLEDRR